MTNYLKGGVKYNIIILLEAKSYPWKLKQWIFPTQIINPRLLTNGVCAIYTEYFICYILHLYERCLDD